MEFPNDFEHHTTSVLQVSFLI